MRIIIYILFLCAVPVVGFTQTPINSQQPQQVLVTDDTCQLLLNYGYSFNSNFMFEAAYDSLRKFVETCPLHKSAYEAFPETGLSVNNMEGDDSLRYEQYLEWLISVLYLNTIDYKYYCADVGQIMNSLAYKKGYERAFFTVLRYLLDHPKCNSLGLQRLWDDSWASLRYDWWKGDTTVPLDSTWPSLDSIGLGFLTKLDVQPQKPVLSSVYLGTASVVPNPMTGSTTLTYELLRSGFIGYTVHDALGNQVFARRSDFADAGKHEEQITLPPSLSLGTYYLRLNVGFGEIRTIRMVVVR